MCAFADDGADGVGVVVACCELGQLALRIWGLEAERRPAGPQNPQTGMSALPVLNFRAGFRVRNRLGFRAEKWVLMLACAFWVR